MCRDPGRTVATTRPACGRTRQVIQRAYRARVPMGARETKPGIFSSTPRLCGAAVEAQKPSPTFTARVTRTARQGRTKRVIAA
jgi:hypothetical protein